MITLITLEITDFQMHDIDMLLQIKLCSESFVTINTHVLLFYYMDTSHMSVQSSSCFESSLTNVTKKFWCIGMDIYDMGS